MTEWVLEPENPFWRFSCAVYAAPGVAQACLELQDTHGADVNLLLLAAWLGAARGWERTIWRRCPVPAGAIP